MARLASLALGERRWQFTVLQLQFRVVSEVYITAGREIWLQQAQGAWQRLNEAGKRAGLNEQVTLAQLSGLDHEAFCLLIEALHALGQPLSQELLDRAAVRPVAELFGS